MLKKQSLGSFVSADFFLDLCLARFPESICTYVRKVPPPAFLGLGTKWKLRRRQLRERGRKKRKIRRGRKLFVRRRSRCTGQVRSWILIPRENSKMAKGEIGTACYMSNRWGSTIDAVRKRDDSFSLPITQSPRCCRLWCCSSRRVHVSQTA